MSYAYSIVHREDQEPPWPLHSLLVERLRKMLAAFGVEVLKFSRLFNIVEAVKGFKRTLLVVIKT